MESRVRLAESPELKRRSVAWPEFLGWRWPRLLRRWGHSLVELKVPRGAGSTAAAMLLLASASYGAVRGGHVPQIMAGQPLCIIRRTRINSISRLSSAVRPTDGQLNTGDPAFRTTAGSPLNTAFVSQVIEKNSIFAASFAAA